MPMNYSNDQCGTVTLMVHFGTHFGVNQELYD